MPSVDPAVAERAARRGGEVALTVALLAALLAALVPVLRVTKPGAWLFGAVLLATLVLAAGYVARRFRLPAVAVSLIEAGVWAVFLTVVFFSSTALLWFIPTPETIRAVPELFNRAMEQIVLGAAPLDETRALSFLIVGAMGLLTIIVDHVVLTARMPLLAAIGIVAVSLIPSIAVPRDVDVPAFVYLAVAILALLRAETRSREKPLERVAERSAGVPATALGIGAVAVIVAVVATPLLPAPGVRPGGLGPGSGIDATLQLGDDLRRPAKVEVLKVWSDSPAPPYLRATTLSRFDGSIWEPDRVRTVPLETGQGLGPVVVPDDMRVSDYKTTVQITNLASRWAPVSYPAVEVSGLDGRWAAVPYNRTIVSQSGSTQGQTYDIQTEQPRPTLEQIRSLEARSPDPLDETMQLPDEMPPIIGELATQVTANATNDYDRLVALQSWFRGGEFHYSLNAPVEDGFDGSGADAVAKFLEQREGYCVHFASAFALMARTLGMPSRIVVGYLPGSANGEIVDEKAVYTVSSQLLHAWPEVYFEDLGWIQFEPTAGLGVPTQFQSAATVTDGSTPGATPGATPRPSNSASAGPNNLNPRDEEASGPTIGASSALPGVSILLGILFLLAVPAIARNVRTRQLAATARSGDAASAWTLVQDAAIDLAIPVPASETPRSFAYRLVDDYGAPPDEMNVLLVAIEKASYAPSRTRDFLASEAVTDAALVVRGWLMSSAPKARRLMAFLAPRSLIVRPGSVYASGSVRAKARAK
jgi:transglutaminase-like putative cysteine protease